MSSLVRRIERRILEKQERFTRLTRRGVYAPTKRQAGKGAKEYTLTRS